MVSQPGYRLPRNNSRKPMARGRGGVPGGPCLVFDLSPRNGFIQLGGGVVGIPFQALLFGFNGLLAVILLWRMPRWRAAWLVLLGRYSVCIVLVHSPMAGSR